MHLDMVGVDIDDARDQEVVRKIKAAGRLCSGPQGGDLPILNIDCGGGYAVWHHNPRPCKGEVSSHIVKHVAP